MIFNVQQCWRHTSGTILFSTTSDRGGSPRLPTKHSSRYAERRGTGIHWWFVQDGAPAHCLPAVRQSSNSLFPEHRTGRCGAHHRGNICSLPFVLHQSASPALATADTECGSRGFTASQATYCDEQFTRALFCTSEMSYGWTAHSHCNFICVKLLSHFLTSY